jgi:hypothetical protein
MDIAGRPGVVGQTLHLADIQVMVDDRRHSRFLRRLIGKPEQCASMTGADTSRQQRLLRHRRQSQQAACIGDRLATPTDPLRDGFIAQTKFVFQRLIGVRLFERIQVGALNILNQCNFERLLGSAFTNDNRHTIKTGAPGSAQTSLASDQFIPTIITFRDQSMAG